MILNLQVTNGGAFQTKDMPAEEKLTRCRVFRFPGKQYICREMDVTRIARLTGHNGSVYTLEKGLDEHTFFSGSSDRFVALWNLKTLQAEKFAAKLPAIIYTLCHVPEKQLLIVGTSAGSVHILDLQKKEEIRVLQHHTLPVFHIRYSIPGNCFYTASGDGNFAICSLETLSLIRIKTLCTGKVRHIDIHPAHSEIAVASGDCNIRIFDTEQLEEKHLFKAHDLSANVVRYSPDGTMILSGGRDAHLNCWDAKSYSLIKSIPAHNFAIYDIAFHPEGKLFATASRDKTVKIWDLHRLEMLVRINKENFDGHLHSVNKVYWSSYRNYLLSSGDDRTIMVWDIGR